MKGNHRRRVVGCTLALGFLGPAIPALWANSPVIDPVVSPSGTAITIVADDDPYTTPASYFADALSLQNFGDFSLSEVPYALRFGSEWTGGENGGFQAPPGQNGGQAGAFSGQNFGDIALTTVNSALNVLWFTAQAGNGGDGTSSGSGNGGSGGDADGGLVATNTGNISLAPNGTYGTTVAVLVQSLGGTGGNAGKNGADPGSGSDANTADSTSSNVTSLNNAGSITLGPTPNLFNGNLAALWVETIGGAPGQPGTFTGTGPAGGGSAGAVEIVNSGALTLIADMQAYAAYGVVGRSVGADGIASFKSGHDGGWGGYSSGVSITLGEGSDIVMDFGSGDGTANPDGAVLLASSRGGNGGTAANNATGGAGGSAATGTGSNAAGVSISLSDATITLTGVQGGAVIAEAIGGLGGAGRIDSEEDPSQSADSSGGAGGAAGEASIQLDVNGASNLSTMNSSQAAVEASSVGGRGGIGAPSNSDTDGAGSGGVGGEAGVATVGLSGQLTITTQGASAYGVLAQSVGGRGGDGRFHNGTSGNAGDGANGARGEVASVSLEDGVTVQTSGSGSVGVFGRSVGGRGGDGGFVRSLGGNGGDGGNGGFSGAAVVEIDDDSSIQTSGDGAHGVAAQSLSGFGGNGGADEGVGGSAGIPGVGGVAGTDFSGSGFISAFVTNAGEITTAGSNAIGILAQGVSGGGGAGGDATGFFFADAASGGNSGLVGAVVVQNSGRITTGPTATPALSPTNAVTPGQASYGILAQSIAGGGGAAGSSTEGVVSLGGDEKTNALLSDGGDVIVLNSGQIASTGLGAIAVLAQSVGGGGGDGGSSESLLVSVGGSGGQGGSGGVVAVSHQTGSINTGGMSAHGLVGQSIGGGGGNAGGALSVGVGVGISIGGNTSGSKDDSAGGDGGSVNITATDATIATANSNAIGILAQSLGGGGGTGGSSATYSVSAGLGGGLSLGGGGGSGGEGRDATVTASGMTISTGFSEAILNPGALPINTLPTDAFGIVAQSVGGGGGAGGSALAETLTVATQVTAGSEVTPGSSISGSFDYAGGGKGSGGGNSTGAGGSGGPAAQVDFVDGSSLTTAGQGSHGIIVQSIGGGGGAGGDSSALAATLNYGRAATAASVNNIALTVTISKGGSGGGGGDGGLTLMNFGSSNDTVATGSSLVTYGDYANGILAQSIGGGGGNAGFGSTTTQAFGNTSELTVNVTLGATGGSGGTAGDVNVNVEKHNQISTWGSGAVGVVAQSIGGGGGTSQGGSFTLGGDATFPTSSGVATIQPGANMTVNLGKQGGSGSDGGEVNVKVDGTISTFGGDATGVLAQSIGGGGGLGGSGGSDASADNPIKAYTEGIRTYNTSLSTLNLPLTANFTINAGFGAGGAGGIASAVHANLTGSVTTQGDWSQGVVAQSVGGGGGKAGSAASSLVVSVVGITFGLGSDSGNAPTSTAPPGEPLEGDGGSATVSLNGASISTGTASTTNPTGYGAFGVVAQSVGGGGGLVVDGSNAATGSINIGGTLSSDGKTIAGGGSGDGGAVEVSAAGANLSTITTRGTFAHGLILQSVGGSGGIGGAGASSDSPDPSATIDVSLGGGTASYGSGGNVTMNAVPVRITTEGANAVGLIAQSVGGGGGMAFTESPGSASLGAYIPVIYGFARSSGGTVDLTLSGASSITTNGAGSHGILAQSIGSGGGLIVAASDDVVTADFNLPASFVAVGGSSTVTVTAAGDITTSGAGAYGILAQSIGTGGGIIRSGSSMLMGTTGVTTSPNGDSLGEADNIAITQSGTLSTTGTNSVGIFAQTLGFTDSIDPDIAWSSTISINGTVTGGSGAQGAGVLVSGGYNDTNTLNVGSNGHLSAASGVAAYYDGPEALDVLNNGTVVGSLVLSGDGTSAGTLTNNGRYNGGDTVHGNMVTNGVFAPGVGTVSGTGETLITGDLTQTNGATLELNLTDLGSSGQSFDSLHIEGNGEFSGAVNVWVPGSFVFQVDQVFQFITVDGSASFDFLSTNVIGLPTGVEVSFFTDLGDVSSFNMQVTAIPEPTTVALLLVASGGYLLAKKRRRP